MARHCSSEQVEHIEGRGDSSYAAMNDALFGLLEIFTNPEGHLTAQPESAFTYYLPSEDEENEPGQWLCALYVTRDAIRPPQMFDFEVDSDWEEG